MTREELKKKALSLPLQPGVYLMMDAKGEVFAKTGYRPGGAEPYVEHLRQLVAEKMPKSAKAEAAKPGARTGAK